MLADKHFIAEPTVKPGDKVNVSNFVYSILLQRQDTFKCNNLKVY